MASMFSKSKIFQPVKKFFSETDKKKTAKENLSNFSIRQEKEEAYEVVERGTLMVPLEKIVGSVGRYHDFDNQFKAQRHQKSERLEGILGAMRKGKEMPPIALYQIKEDFFIVDGHHRFKAATELGRSHIRSKIVELLPSKNTLENNLYNERVTFRDEAGIPDNINLTEPGQFSHLKWQIEEHRKYLEGEKKQEVSFQEGAADWYVTIYKPLATLIRKSRLVAPFPKRTVDDLYFYISVHQWEKGKKRKYGLGIDKLIPTNMEVFRAKMKEQMGQGYPEMKREITFFVLLNVEGKYEDQIIDKLIALDEVREVHSVHGSVDIVTKVVLTRDLLSSDAELISHFTQYSIRQWKGILSSQTLIPGVSKIKGDDLCHI